MSRVWKLQEARDRFSEVVRRAEHEGAQTITVHGKAKAVVISCEEYQRMKDDDDDKPERTGRDLIELFRKGPMYGMNLDFERDRSPVPDPIDLSE